MPDESPNSLRLLRAAEIRQLFGISTSTLYRWVNNGHFPAPVQIGPRVVAWRLADLLPLLSGQKKTPR